MNYSQITPWLFIGNSHDARNVEIGAPFTVVMNVAEDLNISSDDGFPRVKAGLVDGPGNSHPQITMAVTVLQNLIDADERVLVHCHDGRSRSPLIAAAALTVCRKYPTKMDWDTALSWIGKCRDINPAEKLIEAVKDAMGPWWRLRTSIDPSWRVCTLSEPSDLKPRQVTKISTFPLETVDLRSWPADIRQVLSDNPVKEDVLSAEELEKLQQLLKPLQGRAMLLREFCDAAEKLIAEGEKREDA